MPDSIFDIFVMIGLLILAAQAPGPGAFFMNLTLRGRLRYAWLGQGIAYLAYGLVRQSTPARLVSGILVVASVVKVFLLDLAGLHGILRALSFIGLGLVLMAVGLVYQKLVFARRTPQA